MPLLRYTKEDELYTSLLFGRGLYAWYGDYIQDPIEQSADNNYMSPVLTNTINGEKFFAKRFDGDELELDKYRTCILNPVFRDLGLWPADIIEFGDKQIQYSCSLFVRHEYTDRPKTRDRWTGRFALLFPIRESGRYESAESRLASINTGHAWQSTEIRQMAVQITRAIERLNRSGYLYCDIHLSRFFVTAKSCYLNFSNLIYPISDQKNPLTKSTRRPVRGEYPREFAEPAYEQGIIDAMDMRTQNYGLSALLFYLLLDRYAYDGDATEHLHGDDPVSHYNMLDFFLEAPVFIFDPIDHDNELGTNLQRNRDTIALWEELPSDLQRMFVTSLSTDAALRKTDYMPTPGEWLQLFKDLGWYIE